MTEHTSSQRTFWLVVPTLLVCLAVLLTAVWLKPILTEDLRAYELLKQWADTPEQTMELAVNVQYDDRTMEFQGQLCHSVIRERQYTIAEVEGISMYLTDGTLFLENGKAFRFVQELAEQAEEITPYMFILQQMKVSVENGVYTIAPNRESMQTLLDVFMPGWEIPDVQVSAALITEEDQLRSIRFACEGVGFRVIADLAITDAEHAALDVPENISSAVESGAYAAVDLFSDSTFTLFKAVGELGGRDALAAEVELSVDCGPLDLHEDLQYIQWKINGKTIGAVGKNDHTVYFSDGIFCNENGELAIDSELSSLGSAELIGGAVALFLSSDYTYTGADGAYCYVLTLPQSLMEQIAYAVAPAMESMSVRLSDGTIVMAVSDGMIQTITIGCSGSVNIIFSAVTVQLEINVQFADLAPDLPAAVQNTLLQ